MAKLKLCPYCKGSHFKMRAYKKCKNQHKKEKWLK